MSTVNMFNCCFRCNDILVTALLFDDDGDDDDDDDDDDFDRNSQLRPWKWQEHKQSCGSEVDFFNWVLSTYVVVYPEKKTIDWMSKGTLTQPQEIGNKQNTATDQDNVWMCW